MAAKRSPRPARGRGFFSIDKERVRELARLIATRRPAGAADQERYLRAVLPHLLALPALAGRCSRAVAWSEAHCPALLADRGPKWVDGLAEAIQRRPRFRKADELARDLGVTLEERTTLGLRTIGAADRSKRQREADRKAKDRARKKAARAAAGATPRERSLAALKPWEAEGISRRTWERRRARNGAVSDAVSQKRPQQDPLRGSSSTGVDEFATRTGVEAGGRLRAPAFRASLVAGGGRGASSPLEAVPPVTFPFAPVIAAQALTGGRSRRLASGGAR